MENLQEVMKSLAAMDWRELQAAHNEARHNHLRAVEAEKNHPLRKHALKDEDFATLKDHLLDGGGSADHMAIRRELHDALMNRDQAQFWPLLVEHFKACLLAHGHVEPLTGGGVKHNGVARPVPPIG